MGSELSKIYNLYEIFNDFNRLRILVIMYNNECTCDDIVSITNLSLVSIMHQLEFLVSKKVVTKLEVDGDIKYKISDKKFNRIVYQIVNYAKQKGQELL